jgi:uncharacterized membrane protein YheB (UPF0754 family)
MEWTSWLLVPAIAALIGYLTNKIAVTMLFRPHEPRRLLGLRLHGLIPQRQPDLARRIGDVVGQHLLEHRDLVQAIGELDLRPMVERLVDGAIDAKLRDLASLPMIGAFLTRERVSGIRNALVNAILAQDEELVGHLERALEENLDIAQIVADKISVFPTRKMEQLVLDVARRELRAIELWGALLGAIIGIAQVALLEVLQ